MWVFRAIVTDFFGLPGMPGDNAGMFLLLRVDVAHISNPRGSLASFAGTQACPTPEESICARYETCYASNLKPGSPMNKPPPP